MASNSPVWKGSKSLQLLPDFPQWDHDNERASYTLEYEGPYSACVANAPATGQTVAGYTGPILKVSGGMRGGGGKGFLRITIENIFPPAESQPFQPQFEVEWIELDKALAMAPCYRPGGNLELTIADLHEVELWLATEDSVLRDAWKYSYQDSQGAVKTGGPLSAHAQNYATKLRRGQDSYRLWTPMCRKTTRCRNLPTTNPCGIPSTPGFGPTGSGLIYIKTADRAVRSGKHGLWERIEEWTAFDEIDTDIYVAPGGGA